MTSSIRSAPWLSIIGIGEDGRDGLSLAARTCLAQARLVIGGSRHLALAGPIEVETMPWPSPLTDAVPKILARRGEPVCVLASGDPFFYGIGTLLTKALPAEEFTCIPAPSSFGLAASRLGWSLQDCQLVSLHGRDLRRLVRHLQPRAKIIALTWDATTPGQAAQLLSELDCGWSRLHVLEAIGGPRERRRTFRAETFSANDVDPLNMIAIDVEAGKDARLRPLAPGLPDDWFEHDGQITKRDIRAVTLAALKPFPGAHLWDVGAGSGSVAIEWALLDPANGATAIEAEAARAARITRNATRWGVTDIKVVHGRAPKALQGLAPPDAIFIGGGTSDDSLIDTAFAALRPGGTLVVNAVTIETQARLIDHYRAKGGTLTQIAVAHADPVGRFHGWRPAMPVTQWAVTKPWNDAP